MMSSLWTLLIFEQIKAVLITRTKYMYLKEHSGIPLDYAGKW
jgi:hypothetical protein